MQICRAFRSHIISKCGLVVFGSTVCHIGNIRVATSTIVTLGHYFTFFHIIGKGAFHRRIVNVSVNNDGASQSRINRNRFLRREPSHKTRLHKLIRMQAIHVLAIACHAHQRSVARAYAVKRHFCFGTIAVQGLLHNRGICREQGVAHRIEYLERSIHGAYNQEFFAVFFRIVYKHGATHGRGKTNVTREFGTIDASVVNANGHANLLRAKVHHAIAHERIRGLFNTGTLRHIHRNLDSGIAALGCHGVCITGRTDCLDRIELLLGILARLAQMRQQVRTRAVIVSIFAKGILERLANA